MWPKDLWAWGVPQEQLWAIRTWKLDSQGVRHISLEASLQGGKANSSSLVKEANCWNGASGMQDKRIFPSASAQWHFYGHQLPRTLNTEQLPAIHVATLHRQLGLHHIGAKHAHVLGRKLMRRKGKWAELESYIFIMTPGKLPSFCLSFSFRLWKKKKKEFNKCNSFIALVKLEQTPHWNPEIQFALIFILHMAFTFGCTSARGLERRKKTAQYWTLSSNAWWNFKTSKGSNHRS